MEELGYLGYDGTRICRVLWNEDFYDMVELGCLGYGGTIYLGYCGTRISTMWWN